MRPVYDRYMPGIRAESRLLTPSTLHTVEQKKSLNLTLPPLPNRKELINLPSIIEETNVANNCDTFAPGFSHRRALSVCQAATISMFWTSTFGWGTRPANANRDEDFKTFTFSITLTDGNADL